MEELEVLPAFSSTLHVSPLTTGEHILTIVEQSDAFAPAEIQILQAKLAQRRYVYSLHFFKELGPVLLNHNSTK